MRWCLDGRPPFYLQAVGWSMVLSGTTYATIGVSGFMVFGVAVQVRRCQSLVGWGKAAFLGHVHVTRASSTRRCCSVETLPTLPTKKNARQHYPATRRMS